MTVTMYDSTSEMDERVIPANAKAVAGYVGGSWPTFPIEVHRFPHAHHLSIAVNAGEDAECLDIETGDATPAEAPAWFRRQTARGVKRSCFYTQRSRVNELVAVLNHAGIHRDEYRLWVAGYLNSRRPHFPGPADGLVTHADACQYDDKALGRNLDVSICEDSFFGLVPPPHPSNTYQPNDEKNWCIEWDRIAKRKTPAAIARRLFLRGHMLRRRRQITVLARKTGWGLRNRLYRYQQLQKRTG